MEICYYRDPKFNFGDDLNAIVWDELLPDRLRQSPDVVIVGIGSILNEYTLGKYTGSGKRLIVIGSGTSYGAPPRELASMQVLAVRGPYTAAVIGQPHTAVTDSAILLAALKTPTASAPAPERDRVLFMPHHRTLFSTPWADIAAECGMTYVTPQQPVEQILAQFARARLVVTEAMHGAIVADTLRIPWIPVAISPAVEEFKWRDWSQSMDVPFRPQRLTAGTHRDIGRFANMESILRKAGIQGFSNVPEGADATALRSYLDRRFSPSVGDLSWRKPGMAKRLYDMALSVADAIPHKAAVQALAKAAGGPQFLSKDHVFRSRLQQMLDAVGRAEALA